MKIVDDEGRLLDVADARLGLGRRVRRRPRHRLVLVRDRRGGDGRRAEARRDLDRPPPAQRQRADVRPADDAEQVPPPRDVAPGGDRGGDGPPGARCSGSSARSARCGPDRARDVALFRLLRGQLPAAGHPRERSRGRTAAPQHGSRSWAAASSSALPLPPGAPWTDEPIWPDVQIPFTEKQRALHEQGRTPDAMAAAAGERA